MLFNNDRLTIIIITFSYSTICISAPQIQPYAANAMQAIITPRVPSFHMSTLPNPNKIMRSNRPPRIAKQLVYSSPKSLTTLQKPEVEIKELTVATEDPALSSTTDPQIRKALSSSYELTSAVKPDVIYSAVTDAPSCYLHELYIKEYKRDPPRELDPAMKNGFYRWRICEEISNSEVFAQYELEPIDSQPAFAELEDLQNSGIPIQVVKHGSSTEIINPYTVRPIRFYQQLYPRDPKSVPVFSRKEEHVFACLSRKKYSHQLVPFYVSKQYGASENRVHRFVYLEPTDYRGARIMVAESSAIVYKRTKKDVELHYLERRQEHDETERELYSYVDPVCKLNSENEEENQLLRLCTIVLTSSYFKDKMKIVSLRYAKYERCASEFITFRTKTALKQAGGKKFAAKMVRCYATMTDGYEKMFYISRAYKPDEVFVYSTNPRKKEYYLEACCRDVTIVK